MISLRPHLLKGTLLLLILSLSTAAGCQKQSGSEQKGEQSAEGQLVTVAVPGMT